jgi:hypothetical protein
MQHRRGRRYSCAKAESRHSLGPWHANLTHGQQTTSCSARLTICCAFADVLCQRCAAREVSGRSNCLQGVSQRSQTASKVFMQVYDALRPHPCGANTFNALLSVLTRCARACLVEASLQPAACCTAFVSVHAMPSMSPHLSSPSWQHKFEPSSCLVQGGCSEQEGA